MSSSPLFAGETVDYLLGREQRAIDTAGAKEVLANARVLVTGAGGSVGSALVRRLAELPVESIIALDHHEASLFRLGRLLPPDPRLELTLTDIRNTPKMERLLANKRPSVVFHVAAYKHVPLGEQGADELVEVNVLGTESLARAASAAGVSHFVYPSSDKAVNPPSAYGRTKRLAETLLLGLAAEAPSMAIHVVRFVNILGSAGSISETVAELARSHEPIPLTDERMTRFWMSMDEAVDILWNSLALPTGSRTVLDVGDSIPVREMCSRIYARAGGSAPEFVITGARPGERLFEELASLSETLIRLSGGPVFSVHGEALWDHIHAMTESLPALRALVASGDTAALYRRTTELAQQLQ